MRAFGGDRLGQLGRRGQEQVGLDDLLDEADAQGLLGPDHLAGQEEVEGVAQADEPGQALRPGVAGDEPEVDLGLAELGLGARRCGCRRPGPARSRRRGRSR